LQKGIKSLFIALFLVSYAAAPAFAHSTMVSMNPPKDSVQTVAPTQVVITFDEALTSSGAGLTVTAPDGVRVDLGNAKVANTNLSVGVGPITLNGRYVVNYRAVSADGHPVEDSVGFTIRIPSLTATAKPSVAATGESESGASNGEGGSGDGNSRLILIYLGVLVLAVGVATLWSRLGKPRA